MIPVEIWPVMVLTFILAALKITDLKTKTKKTYQNGWSRPELSNLPRTGISPAPLPSINQAHY
jgi:hypothetical protein